MFEAFIAFDQEFPWFFRVVAFIAGAIVGSFLNVCIYRIPAGKSIISPGSMCACGQSVRWYDNIPIVSWILLRGRARCCGRKFTVRYALIEAFTGLLFLLCWLSYPPGAAAAGMVFCAILICATFIDLDHMIIPDRFTIGGAIIGVGFSFAVSELHGFDSGLFIVDSFRSGMASIIGLLIGSALVLWIALLAEVVLRKEAMGFGDVKFLGAIGAFCGWQGAVFAVFGGAVAGTIIMSVILLIKAFFPKQAHVIASGAETDVNGGELVTKSEKGDGESEEKDVLIGRMVPFGPMLALGALLYFLFFRGWVDSYFESVRIMFYG